MLDRAAIRRMLLIRLSAVGDVINTLPAVTALRTSFPGAHLTFVVEDKAADVVLGHPDLDQVVVFPRKRWRGHWTNADTRREVLRYARGLRTPRHDVLLDFQGNLKSGLHDLVAGVPVRIGFARAHSKEMNHWFTNVRVAPPTLRQNRVEKNLALLAPLGVDVAAARYRLPASAASERLIAEFLSSIGTCAREYALLHPGTSAYGAEKRWSLDRFAGLADAIASELGLMVLVAWGPGERAMADEIAGKSCAIAALETRSLMDLAELIRSARVFVGADSGPLHLASAVSTPSVALFGPKDPAIYGPYNPRAKVVHRLGADGISGMDSIQVEDALEAVRALV